MLSINTPDDTARMLADRLRELRLSRGWTRDDLAERSGVTFGSLKRFETSAEISLSNLLKLCFVLQALDDFNKLLLLPEPLTMADVEKRLQKRKRGKRRSK